MFDFEDDIGLPDALPETEAGLAAFDRVAIAKRFNVLRSAIEKVAPGAAGTVLTRLEAQAEEIRSLRELVSLKSAEAPKERDFERFVTPRGIALQGKMLNVGEPGETPCEVWQPGLLDEAKALSPWHQELQEALEARSWCRVMLRSDDGRGNAPTPKSDAAVKRLLKTAPAAIKPHVDAIQTRIFSGGSGAGGDWQQTTVLPMLGQSLRQDPSEIESLFDVIEIPTKTVTLPFASTMPKPYRYGIPSTDNPADFTASTPETTSRSWTADGLACVIQVFDDAAEDAVMATLPMLQSMASMGLRLGFADAIINGDTGGQDTLTGWNPRSMFDSNATFGSSLDHRRGFIGLRALAADASNTRDASSDTTSWTSQTLKAAMASLKAPHGIAGELVYLASPEHYIGQLLVDTNLLTVDKFGPNATNLAGQVAKVLNVSIVRSELITADLAASGLYTGSGSKTGGLLFNRARFKIVRRKGLMVELERRVINGVTYIVVVARQTFKSIDGATDKTVHWSYNL